MDALFLLVGLAVGGALGWSLAAGRVARRAHEDLAAARAREAEVRATLEAERRGEREKLVLLEESQQRLKDAFRSLSADALRESSQYFLEVAKTTLERLQSESQGDLFRRETAVQLLVQPIQETLSRVSSQVEELEKARAQAYGTITEQVRSL